MANWKDLFGTKQPAPASGETNSLRARAVADLAVEAKADLALKMAVVTSQKVRWLEAAGFRSISIKVSGEVLKHPGRAYNEEYLPRVKGRKGHGVGHRDTFALAGAMLYLGNSVSQEHKSVIKAWLTAHASGTKSAQKAVILLFAQTKCTMTSIDVCLSP